MPSSPPAPPPTDTEADQVRAVGALMTAASWSTTFEMRRRQTLADNPGCSALQASLIAATEVVLLVTSPGGTAPPVDLDSLLSPAEPIDHLQRALRVWLSDHQDSTPAPVSLAPAAPVSSDSGLLARTGRLGAAVGSTLRAASSNLSQKSAGFIQNHLSRKIPSIDRLQPAAEGIQQWAARWTGWDSSMSAARNVLAGLDEILAPTAPAAPEFGPPLYAAEQESSPWARPTLSRFPATPVGWRSHWVSLARAVARQQDDRRAAIQDALSALPLDGTATAPTEEEGVAVFIARLAGASEDQASVLAAVRGDEFPDGARAPRPDLALVFAVGNLLEDIRTALIESRSGPAPREEGQTPFRRPAGPAP